MLFQLLPENGPGSYNGHLSCDTDVKQNLRQFIHGTATQPSPEAAAAITGLFPAYQAWVVIQFVLLSIIPELLTVQHIFQPVCALFHGSQLDELEFLTVLPHAGLNIKGVSKVLADDGPRKDTHRNQGQNSRREGQQDVYGSLHNAVASFS